MAAGIGVFFVDGGGEHADGAKEELAIFLGGLLEARDVLSMSSAMWLKVSASSLISAAPRTCTRS